MPRWIWGLYVGTNRVAIRANRVVAVTGALMLLLLGVVVLSDGGQARAATLSADVLVTTHAAPSTSVTSPAFTTTQPGELLVAFVSADGPSASGTQTVTTVTGAGVTWRLRQRTNGRAGTAEIWTAVAPTVVTNATVRAAHAGSYVASITVA